MVHDREPWHLDKKVPIALIATICIQTVGAVSFVTRMDTRIESLEVRTTNMELWKDGTQDKLDGINVTLGRIDERMIAQANLLMEIKNSLRVSR